MLLIKYNYLTLSRKKMRSKCTVSTICSKNSTAEINIDDYAGINKVK